MAISRERFEKVMFDPHIIDPCRRIVEKCGGFWIGIQSQFSYLDPAGEVTYHAQFRNKASELCSIPLTEFTHERVCEAMGIKNPPAPMPVVNEKILQYIAEIQSLCEKIKGELHAS